MKTLFKTNKILAAEQIRMLKGAAIYHFKADGWEFLEEIFEYHPSTIAAVLNANFGARPSKFQHMEPVF